jgi:hypothetical protein
MAPRDDLHQLIDELPEAEVTAARRFLEFLRAQASEEKLSDEQEKGLVDALESLKRGEGLPAEQVFARWRKLAP